MTTRRLHPLTRALLHLPARLYGWNAGWVLGSRFLLLTHVGRRTGRPHRTVLEVIGRNPAASELFVIVGLGRSADWYQNLQAGPAIEVAVGRRRFRPEHRTVPSDEAAAVLADYEHRNRLVAPVVRLVLSRLVGWRYDGTDEARRRLTRELPVVGFTPVDQGATTSPPRPA